MQAAATATGAEIGGARWKGKVGQIMNKASNAMERVKDGKDADKGDTRLHRRVKDDTDDADKDDKDDKDGSAGQKAVQNLVVCLAEAGVDPEAKSLMKGRGAVAVLLKNVKDLWAQLRGEGGIGKAVEAIGGKFDTMKSGLQDSYDKIVKAESTHAKEAEPCSNGNNAECDGITCGKMK